MSIVRAIDSNGDWLFGQSLNNYISGNMEIQQDIRTRLLSFLGNCFFATTDGINWYGLLGYKNNLSLTLAVSAAILNTPGVTGILQLSVSLNTNRQFSISYQAQTVYSTTGDIFQYNLISSTTI